MGNVIEIRGLVKRFDHFTLGPMDLTVPEGGIYGYIGPNGSGKTLTLDLIMGMGREDAVLALDRHATSAVQRAYQRDRTTAIVHRIGLGHTRARLEPMAVTAALTWVLARYSPHACMSNARFGNSVLR